MIEAKPIIELPPGEFFCRGCDSMCSVFPQREVEAHEQYCTSCKVEQAARFAGRGRYEK